MVELIQIEKAALQKILLNLEELSLSLKLLLSDNFTLYSQPNNKVIFKELNLRLKKIFYEQLNATWIDVSGFEPLNKQLAKIFKLYFDFRWVDISDFKLLNKQIKKIFSSQLRINWIDI